VKGTQREFTRIPDTKYGGKISNKKLDSNDNLREGREREKQREINQVDCHYWKQERDEHIECKGKSEKRTTRSKEETNNKMETRGL